MLKLSLGSGPRVFEGFTHIDGGNFPHVHQHDITKLLQHKGSVDTIYASHVLEYFDRQEAVKVLREWRRVLKPEGELYLSVPDFQAMTDLYIKEGQPLHKFVGPLYGRMIMNGKAIYHKTTYDYSSLGEMLGFVGFRRIEPWTHDQFSKDHLNGRDYDDHSHARINGKLISLNIKCQK